MTDYEMFMKLVVKTKDVTVEHFFNDDDLITVRIWQGDRVVGKVYFTMDNALVDVELW